MTRGLWFEYEELGFVILLVLINLRLVSSNWSHSTMKNFITSSIEGRRAPPCMVSEICKVLNFREDTDLVF